MYHLKKWMNAKPLLLQRFFLCGFTEIDFRFIRALGSFLMFPFSIFRSGVLRQGFEKFYSVSFLARLSLFASLLTAGSPES
jgi:hypothetical protein